MSEFEGYLEALRAELDVDPKRADEICAEVRAHLDARGRQLEKTGLSPQDAVAEAIRSFGDAERMAAELRAANSRHRSFGAFRALGTLTLVWGTMVVVVGGGDFWDRTLIQALTLNLHLSVSQAMWVALVILVSPGALLAGMLAGRRHWWVPTAAPTLLLVIFVCLISWAELLTGRWEDVIDALIPLSGTVVVGGTAFLGSRLDAGKPKSGAVAALAGVYLLAVAAAGASGLRDAVGVLATIAVVEAGLGVLGLAALWDRYGWQCCLFWVGSVLCALFAATMVVAGTHHTVQADLSLATPIWAAIVAGETAVGVAGLLLHRQLERRPETESRARPAE
ncbi:MAG: hypothetical protein JSV79_07205 [Armatimonadota bacterium]|nr:MAG: hypothetical protein JSV79_07205 [Armatimonadota bacterium]